MKKIRLNDGFKYDLRMIPDSGLLFWATLYNGVIIIQLGHFTH